MQKAKVRKHKVNSMISVLVSPIAFQVPLVVPSLGSLGTVMLLLGRRINMMLERPNSEVLNMTFKSKTLRLGFVMGEGWRWVYDMNGKIA
jgi:hypothetical protein